MLISAPFTAFAQTSADLVPVEPSLPETVVTGARAERALVDVPASIEVLEGTRLDPAAVHDIRDLVRDVPNVSVQRSAQRFSAVSPGGTGREGNAGFNIRGLEGNRVLLTIDGVRVPREMASGVFGSAAFGRDYFDLGLISKIEILRGASSTLYGSDGLAGMVSMTTTQPRELIKQGQTMGGRIVASIDSSNEKKSIGASLASQPNEQLQWMLSLQSAQSAALKNQGDITTLDHTRTAPNPQSDRNHSILAKVVLSPNKAQTHTLTAEHVDKQSEVEVLTARTSTPTSITDTDALSNSTRSRLSWEGVFNAGSPMLDVLRASTSYQKADSMASTTETRATTPSQRARNVRYTEAMWQAVLQAEKTTSIGNNWGQKLVYGSDLSVAELDNLVTGIAPPSYERYPLQRFPTTRESNLAAFVQSEWISEQWSVIPALRYDRFELTPKTSALYPLTPASLSGSAFSPKLGIVFRATPSWSVFANAASGYKAPSPLQLNNFFENATGGYKSIPNPDLVPEKSQTIEAGTRASKGALKWEAAAFTGRYKDFIEELVRVGGTGAPGNPLQFKAVNRGRVTLTGFEFKGSYALSKATQLKWGYGQTKGRDTAQDKALNSVNPPKWVLGIDHAQGPWTVGAALTHVAAKSPDQINQNLARGLQQFASPAYTTLDLKATWLISQRFKLSAALNNLTDRKYWEWTNVRGIAASSAALDAYTAPGRSLSVALTSTF